MVLVDGLAGELGHLMQQPVGDLARLRMAAVSFELADRRAGVRADHAVRLQLAVAVIGQHALHRDNPVVGADEIAERILVLVRSRRHGSRRTHRGFCWGWFCRRNRDHRLRIDDTGGLRLGLGWVWSWLRLCWCGFGLFFWLSFF